MTSPLLTILGIPYTVCSTMICLPVYIFVKITILRTPVKVQVFGLLVGIVQNYRTYRYRAHAWMETVCRGQSDDAMNIWKLDSDALNSVG